MTIAIWLHSTKLSKLDFGWILHHTTWELKQCCHPKIVMFTSRWQSLANDVEYLRVGANKEDSCTFMAEQLRLMCTLQKVEVIPLILLGIHFRCFINHLLAMKS